MVFSIESISGYQAKDLLDNYTSFSNDLQQFIIFNIDALIKKAEEYLNHMMGKPIVFPVSYRLFRDNGDGYTISKKCSEVTIGKDFFKIQNKINSYIHKHKISHADSGLMHLYKFICSKSLYESTDSVELFNDFLNHIMFNVENYYEEYQDVDGLFSIMDVLNLIMELIIYKSSAIGIRISVVPRPKTLENSNPPTEFGPTIFNAIYTTLKQFYVTDDDKKSCFALTHLLSDFHNTEKTMIEGNLNSFLTIYFDVKQRLCESSGVKITPVEGAKDFIDSLSNVKGKMDKPGEFNPVIYGDKSCIPSSMSNTMFTAYIHSLKLPTGFSTTPNSNKVTNFFGGFKRNYNTCCIYNGTQTNIIVRIDDRIYLLGENLPTGEVILVELDPDKFSYKNIYTVNILGEYKLESGDIL